ncbi:MAG TPA: beta-propeller domain-containing protein [Clostridia bacterium]|nr:beta-propeller domain-containing protein [Clostridia bacterium]
MRNNKKQILEKFKNKYNNSASISLPQGLSKESVVQTLGNDTMPQKKIESKMPVTRKVLAAAIAIAVIASSAFIYNGVNNAPRTELPGEFKTIESYEEINDAIKTLKRAQKKSVRDILRGYSFTKSTDEMDLILNEGAPQDGSNGSASFGKTNTQVEGVDEADTIKNDGKYLYQNFYQGIYIVSLLPADNMKVVSIINLYDDNKYANEIYVKGDRLVVVGHVLEKDPWLTDFPHEDVGIYPYYSQSNVFVNIYDISDKSDVKLKTEFFQDGTYVSSRLIENNLYLISQYMADVESNKEEDYVPSSGYSEDVQTVPANDIYIVGNPDIASYLVTSGINIETAGKKTKTNTKAVFGAGGEAYCNTESLFVAVGRTKRIGNITNYQAEIYSPAQYDYYTEIYRFDLNKGRIEYKCNGKVGGTIKNQFSMDEYNNHFRIATTDYDDKGVESSGVYILDKDLKIVGSLTGLAEKERIYAVRFIGETGYIVTFERVDPLFVIDLSDEKKPKLLGELKITGFSEYLHPVGENMLIGIGHDGDEEGQKNGIKISLFDVSNPAKPSEIDKYIIDIDSQSYYIDTTAWYNHKAVMVNKEKALFGIDVTIYDHYNPSGPNEQNTFRTFSVEDNRIIPGHAYKGVAFSQEKRNNSSYDVSSSYWGGYGTTQLRGTYIENNIYVISHFGIKSYSMDEAKKLGVMEF